MRSIAAVGLVALALVLIAAVRTASAGCCGNDDMNATAKTEGETIAQKTCPVMGNPINPKIFVDYKDRRIYFCCKMCPPTFNKDPEKYVKIVDEQLKTAKGANAKDPAAEGHESHSH